MVTTTTLPTLVRVTKSRERPEKVVRVTKEKAQLCRSGEAERALEGRDGKSLDKAFQQYLEYRTVKEPIMEDNRWRNVLKLQTLLTRPEYANIYLAGREHALYEELHRSNPERFVSKSRFMVIMRRVFGFELAPVRGAVDADVKELIENVYDAFDERGNDKMEWRGILLMLHVVLKPWLPPVAHFSRRAGRLARVVAHRRARLVPGPAVRGRGRRQAAAAVVKVARVTRGARRWGEGRAGGESRGVGGVRRLMR